MMLVVECGPLGVVDRTGVQCLMLSVGGSGARVFGWVHRKV